MHISLVLQRLPGDTLREHLNRCVRTVCAHLLCTPSVNTFCAHLPSRPQVAPFLALVYAARSFRQWWGDIPANVGRALPPEVALCLSR